MLVRRTYHNAIYTGAHGRGAKDILSIGLSRIQLILSLWAEISCKQGSGPRWIYCMGTLPERILSTTSASSSIISNTDWIRGSSSKLTYPIMTAVRRAVTHYQINHFRVACGCIKLTVFIPQTSILAAIFYMLMTQTTPTHQWDFDGDGSWPVTTCPDREKLHCRKWALYKERGLFSRAIFVQRSREKGNPVPNKAAL